MKIPTRFSVLGDSVSTFQGITQSSGVYYAPSTGAVTGVHTAEDTWWMQVILSLGGILLANNSWSGSTVSAAGNLGACSEGRIRKLSAEGMTPDHVLVFSGLNDISRYIPLVAFRRDYALMLRRIRDLYPDATVSCGTLVTGYLGDPPLFPRLSYFGQRLAEYNDAIRDAAAETDVHLADLAALDGVSESRYESMDGLHPSGEGMKQLARLWLRCLKPGAD